MSPARKVLAVLGTALVLGGAWFSVGAPRLVLVNAGVHIEYPPRLGWAAMGAVMGLALVAFAVSRLAVRLVIAVAALGTLFVALHLLLYRLEATESGLVSRGVLGTTAIAWRDIVGLDRGGDLLLLNGRNGGQIRVDTTDFSPTQRATLQRTIARRVQESGGKLTVPPL
jgi:Bacterial PH domain